MRQKLSDFPEYRDLETALSAVAVPKVPEGLHGLIMKSIQKNKAGGAFSKMLASYSSYSLVLAMIGLIFALYGGAGCILYASSSFILAQWVVIIVASGYFASIYALFSLTFDSIRMPSKCLYGVALLGLEFGMLCVGKKLLSTTMPLETPYVMQHVHIILFLNGVGSCVMFAHIWKHLWKHRFSMVFISRRKRRMERQLGFTFLEILIVLVMLAVLSAIALTRFSQNPYVVYAEAEALKSNLRFAQSKAMSDIVPWGVVISSNGYSLQRDGTTASIRFPGGGTSNSGSTGTSLSFPAGVNVNPIGTVTFDNRGQPLDSANAVQVTDTVFTLSKDGTDVAITITARTGFIP